MAGTLVVSTINSGNQAFNIDDVAKGLAKAWVNFDASGATIAIKKSLNVTSITDNSTGKFTVNLTTPMPDAAYAVVGTAKRSDSNVAGTDNQSIFVCPSLYTASNFHICVCSTSAVLDSAVTNVAVFD